MQQSATAQPWPVHRKLAYFGLGVWVALCVVCAAYLLASQLLTLPAPAVDDPVLPRAIAANHRAEPLPRFGHAIGRA